MSLVTYKQWKESSATTRDRNAAAWGLHPWTGHLASATRSTPTPWEWDKAEKAHKKEGGKKKTKKRYKKKAETPKKMDEARFGATPTKKKVTPKNRNVGIDQWISEVERLKEDLEKLHSFMKAHKRGENAKATRRTKSSRSASRQSKDQEGT